MIRIRPAAQDDVPWLLDALTEFDLEFPAHRSLFRDAEYVSVQLRQAIDAGPFYVAEVPVGDGQGYAVGFMLGALLPHYLNPEVRVLVELLWWVDPAYRSTRASSLLLDAYLAYGREHADWVMVTERCTEPGRRAFARRGLRSYERNYLLEVT